MNSINKAPVLQIIDKKKKVVLGFSDKFILHLSCSNQLCG